MTTVGFRTHLEYGTAGQVVDGSGKPVADATVKILDKAGTERGEPDTNGFGYYRVDGLPTGHYQAVLIGEDGAKRSIKEFSIKSGYVFDINLKAN